MSVRFGTVLPPTPVLRRPDDGDPVDAMHYYFSRYDAARSAADGRELPACEVVLPHAIMKALLHDTGERGEESLSDLIEKVLTSTRRGLRAHDVLTR